MPDNVEIGCLRGMDGNVLNVNVCSVTPVNVSVPTTGGQTVLELSLPTCGSREQSAVHFLQDHEEYLKLKKVDERLKLTLVSKSLSEVVSKTCLWKPKNISTVMRRLTPQHALYT